MGVFIDLLELAILVKLSLILVLLLKHQAEELFHLYLTVPLKQVISITALL